MARLVFLDFDGVLNSHHWLYRPDRDKEAEFLGNEHHMLDPTAVGRVNRILRETGAKVVISSSWRHGWPVERLREILTTAGFVGEVLGYTPQYGHDRGHEIEQWLDGNDEGHDPFVILDDDSDMGPLMKYLVKTTFEHGIQDEHVEDAIRRLLK